MEDKRPPAVERLTSVASMEVESEGEADAGLRWAAGNTKFVVTDTENKKGKCRTVSDSGPVRARVYEGRSFRSKRKTTTASGKPFSERDLSEEVKRMAMGKKLTHFQALSLLHKVILHSETAREDESDEESEEEGDHPKVEEIMEEEVDKCGSPVDEEVFVEKHVKQLGSQTLSKPAE